ncbi:MAG: PAS domain S-box protein [Chitinispirillaceae bacterium]|nr:PAS domain S-box protein [Chitinispirillaceae bacterium]
MTSSSTPLYPDNNIRNLTRVLFDKLALFAITFGAFATLGSMLKIAKIGWHISIILDVTTYLLVVTVLLFRSKLPSTLVGTLFILVLTVSGCLKFFFVGLLTVNFTLLISCCVVAGTLFGYSAGLLVLFMSISILSIAGFLFSTGKIACDLNVATYMNLPQSWISQLSGYIVFSLASLTVVHFIQKQLLNSFKTLQSRTEELRASEKKYRLLAENMRDVLLLIDLEFRITYISPSVSYVFDYTPEELHMKSVDYLTNRQHSEHLIFFFSHFIKQARQHYRILPEFEFQRKNGSSFIAEFTPSLILNDNGDPVGIQGILRDLSEKKAVEKEKALLEEQLRQSEKMQVIGQLAGGIAHDFNNQLAGIMGFAECIKADHPEDSETHATAKAITGIVTRAADLTGKLLAFARKGNYLSQTIDVHAIISEVSGILARSIDRSITILQKLDAARYHIQGDPGQVQNALLNIALNGRDAMKQGGTLTFATVTVELDSNFATPYQQKVTPAEYIHIAISDTGTGISDIARRHLFEPFFTTKEPGKGTGMGLAAVYGTVQSHNGVLDVNSETEKGTTFHIYLPLGNTPIEVTEPKLPSGITVGTGTILVVDDEVSVAKMIKMVLGRLGYSVETATNGADALALVRKKPGRYRGIVLDLILPGMNGKKLFKAFREIRESQRILICSGYSPDNEVQHLLNDDITYFLQKPFTMSELSTQLDRLLSYPGK